jgi:hypothetical protein
MPTAQLAASHRSDWPLHTYEWQVAVATTNRGLGCTAQRPRLMGTAAAIQPRATHALCTVQQLQLPHLQCYPAILLLPVLVPARGTLSRSAFTLDARLASGACPAGHHCHCCSLTPTRLPCHLPCYATALSAPH